MNYSSSLTENPNRNRHRLSPLPPSPAPNWWHRALGPQFRGTDIDMIHRCPSCPLPLAVIEFSARPFDDRPLTVTWLTGQAFSVAFGVDVPAYAVHWRSIRQRTHDDPALERLTEWAEPPCGCVDHFDPNCRHGMEADVWRLRSPRIQGEPRPLGELARRLGALTTEHECRNRTVSGVALKEDVVDMAWRAEAGASISAAERDALVEQLMALAVAP